MKETVEMYSKRVQNLLQKLATTNEWSQRTDGALILVNFLKLLKNLKLQKLISEINREFYV